jgi:hypothetical protein
MEPADPDFYRIGYARMMRAYGIEFLEGPDGMGVYASRDVEPLRRARVRHFSPCHTSTSEFVITHLCLTALDRVNCNDVALVTGLC